jgi:hypothetical protein
MATAPALGSGVRGLAAGTGIGAGRGPRAAADRLGQRMRIAVAAPPDTVPAAVPDNVTELRRPAAADGA